MSLEMGSQFPMVAAWRFNNHEKWQYKYALSLFNAFVTENIKEKTTGGKSKYFELPDIYEISW